MNVHIAPQRNHQKARKRSFGLTFGFSSLSRSAWKGTFTRLKKNRCPNQMMPNMMCPNRSRTLISDGGSRNMRALYTHSAGRSTHSGSSARLTSGAEWDGELLVLREQARNPVGRKRSERPPTLRPRSSPSHSAPAVAPRLRFGGPPDGAKRCSSTSGSSEKRSSLSAADRSGAEAAELIVGVSVAGADRADVG